MFKEYSDYLRDNPHHYWFKNKLYGWGWTPVRWQGWLVLALYLIGIFALSLRLDQQTTDQEAVYKFMIPVAILTAILLVVCYKTGEKPHWQWGIPKK